MIFFFVKLTILLRRYNYYLWYNAWKNRYTSQTKIKSIIFFSLLDETNLYPDAHTALTVVLTLPLTTCFI